MQVAEEQSTYGSVTDPLFRENVKTRCTPQEMYESLRLAWYSVFGDANPRHESLLILLSHWNIETGEGAHMHNWNVGNVKSVAGDGYLYTWFDNVWEGLSPDHAKLLILKGEATLDDDPSHIAAVGPSKIAVKFKAGHPQTRFRAFESLDEGAEKYLRILTMRFSTAINAVTAGDPDEFVRILASHGYFTANAGAYDKALKLRLSSYMKTIKPGDIIT